MKCTLLVILISFIIAFYFYPQMPEKMASHWNTENVVDGYMPKSLGLFLIPLILLALAMLFAVIPKIDPLRENIKKFKLHYNRLVLIITVFLFYVYMLTIIWNIGLEFNMGQVLIPAIAVLFYYLGILLEKAKRNWFIGIRTPWTLSNAYFLLLFLSSPSPFI